MRIVFEYKGIEIIAQGGERELTLFVNRLVGNEPRKEQRAFKDKKCPVCKEVFTPRSGAQKRCDDCMKGGSKIPKKEKKADAKIPIDGRLVDTKIRPPDRNCFGEKYEYGSAFCTGSCKLRVKCKEAFEGKG